MPNVGRCLFVVVALFGSVLGCEDPPGDGFLLVGVSIGETVGTELEGLRTLDVTIKRVDVIHRTDANDPGTEKKITLLEEENSFRISGLDERMPRVVGRFAVPAGFVMQLRLVTKDDESIVIDVAGMTSTVKLPSGPQTGLKIQSVDEEPFEIKEQQVTAIRVLLDPEKQVIRNNGVGFIMKPVVRAEVVDPDTLTFFVDGEVIVRFKDGVSAARQAERVSDFLCSPIPAISVARAIGPRIGWRTGRAIAPRLERDASRSSRRFVTRGTAA